MLSITETLDWSGFPRRVALAVTALGLTVLAGWALDVHLIKSALPGAIEMKANTALCFLLAGGALFLRLQTPGWQRPAQGMALAVAAIGLVTLGEYAFGWQLGIDQLLFREPAGALYTLHLGRMSVYAATGFSAAGFALLALPRPTLHLPVQLTAVLTVFVGAGPLFGYLWSINAITTASTTTPAALHTSIAFILLGAALLRASQLAALQTGRATPFNSVEFKVLLGFVGTLLLILFGSSLTYRASVNFAESAKLVARTQEVRIVLGDLYSGIADAESVQRAYLLTGEKSRRANYVRLAEAVPPLLDSLAQMITDKTQLHNLATLRPIIARRLEILAQVMKVYESQGLAAAQQEIISSQSLETMSSIHALTDAMETVEIQLLKQRETETEQTRQFTLASMLLTLLLAVSLLTALFIAIRREIRLRVSIQEQINKTLEQRVQQRTEALKLERDKLKAVFENTSLGLVLTNAQGGDLSMNAAALGFHGFNSAEDMHRRVEEYADDWELRYPDGRIMPFNEWPLPRAVRGDYVQNHEVHCRNLKNDYQWIGSYTSVPVRNSAGEVILIVMTLFDITERRKNEAKLQRVTRFYATLSQCNQAIVRCTNEEELFPQICQDAVTFGGMKMAWIGLVDEADQQVKPVASFGDGDGYLADVRISMDAGNLLGQSPVATAIRENQPFWCQDFLNDPHTAACHERGARAGWAASAALPLHCNGVAIGALTLYAGEVNAFDEDIRKLLLEMATDISFALDGFVREAGRKQAYAALRVSEARNRAITQSAYDAIITSDSAGNIAGWNRGAEIMFGYTEAEAMGQAMTLLIPERYREGHLAGMNRIRSGAEPRIIGKVIELHGLRKDGSEFPLELTLAKWEGADGWFATAIIGDITERKQAEHALCESEAELRAIFEGASDGILVADAESGKFVTGNPTICRMLGYTLDEVVGLSVPDIHPKQDLPRVIEEFERLVRGEIQMNADIPVMRKDGSVFYADIKGASIRLSGKDCVLGIFRDITERKAAEDQLRKLSLAVEQSPGSIVITDVDARIEYVNDAFVRATGYSREEVIGKNPRILHSGKTPPATYVAMWGALVQGRPWKGEFHNRRKDGSEYIEFAIVTPLRRPDGSISHYVAVKEDITEKKRLGEELDAHRHHLEQLVESRTVELTAARQQAEAANQSKSSFLANMSHELRTPLNAIIGFSEALKDGLMGELTESQRESIDDIYTSGEHLLLLINDILDLSKVESGRMTLELEPVSVKAMLHNSLSMVKGKALNHRLKLTLEADAEMPEMVADMRKLKQIVYNLLSNAIKFTPDGGAVTLAAHRVDGMLEIAVSDTGIGISAEDQARLFQPFTQIDSTLSRLYQGTGLGLVMVKHLAELHGGSVGLESEPGKGSRFWVRIPWRMKEDASAPSAEARRALQKKR